MHLAMRATYHPIAATASASVALQVDGEPATSDTATTQFAACVGVFVGVRVARRVDVTLGVNVIVFVGTCVIVGVLVAVTVDVGVAVDVLVEVEVNVVVAVAVSVGV